MASPNASDHSEEDEEDAMAALMGFSTFGNQGPSKKRKFNPKTDAVVDGQDLEVLDKGGKKGQGSGGNQVPLGKMRTSGGGQKDSGWNQDEIMLDDDDEEEDNDDDGMESGGVTLTSQADVDSDSSPGPVYIDTSQPPPIEDTDKFDDEETDEAARIAQAKIDAILANQSTASMAQTPPIASRSNPVAALSNISNSQTPSKSKSQSALPGRGMSAYLSALRDVPQPPLPGTLLPPPLTSQLPGTTAATFQNLQPPSNLPPKPQSQNLSHNSHQNAQRGQRNELWYIGYYDRRFNENPWQELEKKSGLEPVGTWIGRQ